MHANPIRILRADARGNIEIGRDHRSGDSAVVFPGDLLQIGDLVAKVDGKVGRIFYSGVRTRPCSSRSPALSRRQSMQPQRC